MPPACAGYLGHPFIENNEFRERMSQVASTATFRSQHLTDALVQCILKKYERSDIFKKKRTSSMISTAREQRTSHGRDGILQAALQLFSRRGYDATSIDDIRRAAGFKSKASLYTHFKSKE